MAAARAGLIVVLHDEVPAQDAEAIAAAIRLIRGVDSVHDVSSDPDTDVIRERVNAEWRERIVDLLDDEGV